MPDTDREQLGRLVRQVWVRWASEQRRPKRSWLVGWDQLGDGQREVDMRIGETVAAHVTAKVMGDLPGVERGYAVFPQAWSDLIALGLEVRGVEWLEEPA